MGKRKAGLPGTWGWTGVEFLLPSPQVTHSAEFGRAAEWASKTKTSNRLNGFHSLPFSEVGQGLSPSVVLPALGSWGSERWSGFPKVTEPALGPGQQTPLPQCCLGHNGSQAVPSLLSPGHTWLHF